MACFLISARVRLACVVLIILLALPGAAAADEREVFFEQRIRPVLAEKCYSCHSTAADVVKGGLLLDSAAAMAKGGVSEKAAVVPGDTAASLLLEAIRYENPNLQMPPKEPLPENVAADFERWIQEGAVFPASEAPVNPSATALEHWAFLPPQPQALPAVQHAAWPRTEIDYFVLAALEAKGLSPSPEADRRTLIRRLTFDLTGLPPTPEEVEVFEADTSPQAYEALGERLLASPHYGERWARHWLDVARYADTKGYVYGGREEANFTHSHVYRDWVVDAFNRDRPYDQFIRLQLAADAITGKASREDLAAMGFLTLGQRFLGVVPDIVDDRIDTVTRGFMGLTVSCARCHDHKFDPVPIEDYYSLYGVFSASSERTLPLRPKELEEERFTAFTEELRKREAKLEETFAAKSRALEERLRAQADRYLAAVPTANTLPTDDFYQILNAEDLNPTMVRRWAAYIARQGVDHPIFGLWNRLAELPAAKFEAEAATVLAASQAPAPGDIVLSANGSSANPLVLAAMAAAPPKSVGDVAARYGEVFKSVHDAWTALGEGASALPDPAQEAIRQELFAPGSPVLVPEGAIVDLEWMFDEPTRVELGTLNADIERWIITAETAPDYATILADKPERPLPRVFKRGNAAAPGDEVPRQFLELLSGDARRPFEEGSGRRELAEAIASADNPLTARVMVNRVWGWHFGRGIVATPSDFGTRAATPSHPELLDWLALNFIEQGWSLKQLHRQIVNSAAYRQSSILPEDDPRVVRALEADPENALLWRFNRRRLDFESLRDALLLASGSIDTTLGGRPVDLTASPYPVRRTIYGRVDRQFLPAVLRVFDFPNPDMHSPARIDTVVPQQALFLMNNPFVQAQARALAARAGTVDELYRHVYQRTATPEQAARAAQFLAQAEAVTPPAPPEVVPSAWSYGYGKFDEATGKLASFTELPHFTGSAWQGGANWPDGALGWLQLTADGGHPGNTVEHAVVRRWTAPAAGTVSYAGRIRHDRPESDGIMARVSSSRHGLLGAWPVHHREADANGYGIVVEAGDTLDFIVDIRAKLNNDQFLWSPEVAMMEGEPVAWKAAEEFAGPHTAPPVPLSPWEKLAQVLLVSNEFLFVD
jgi:hypothetical protein